jgi:protein phosphatase
MATTIKVPELSLVLLIGASGSGKSTFARRHFAPTEVISSDVCRALVSDRENDQSATKDAFDVLHYIAAKRLGRGRLTVIDATNVRPEDRRRFVELAREYHCLPVAIVLDIPERIAHERNAQRPDRDFGPHVVQGHIRALRRSLRGLQREGFRHVFVLDSPGAIDEVTIERAPLWNNLRHVRGPFDIIGDVHGCCTELEALLARLGYVLTPIGANGATAYTHPEGRTAIFLGDLVDRGPRVIDSLYLVKRMVDAGTALVVPGNHDVKLLKKLRGRDVRIAHGLQETLDEIAALDDAERARFMAEIPGFIDAMVSHFVLDDGRLVVAHAGMKESMQGRGSGAVRDFALYGETTGETDEFGLPVRYNWASEYRGEAMVVYGHTPTPEPEWINRTICIDTGCVFGGRLTALRYPERELVSVAAERMYSEPVRPLVPIAGATVETDEREGDLLDITDVLGKRIVRTRLQSTVTIREENAVAALEVMSRWAVDPRWLIYLPPTMSPSETTSMPGLLEHPSEAFAYFRNQGIATVVCEEKHMGSRAVVVLCRDEETAGRRFGITGEGTGVCFTRTGRRFFEDRALEAAFLDRINASMDRSGLWQALETDWVCLDTELMPWSAKAQELLKSQYAAVGAAMRATLPEAVVALRAAGERRLDVSAILDRFEKRTEMADLYVRSYRNYCWPVNSIEDLRLAPFHILASEGRAHIDRDHRWHMETIARLCAADETLLLNTRHMYVDVNDDDSVARGTSWWTDMTSQGGEGMVVKPLDFIAQGRRGIVQPAVKCRGSEYLRIIYGPEYTAPENLERLRARGLSTKRSLALREFALGIEALERFVQREPLYKVHECVFGVLALESEPVDPRL